MLYSDTVSMSTWPVAMVTYAYYYGQSCCYVNMSCCYVNLSSYYVLLCPGLLIMPQYTEPACLLFLVLNFQHHPDQNRIWIKTESGSRQNLDQRRTYFGISSTKYQQRKLSPSAV